MERCPSETKEKNLSNEESTAGRAKPKTYWVFSHIIAKVLLLSVRTKKTQRKVQQAGQNLNPLSL